MSLWRRAEELHNSLQEAEGDEAPTTHGSDAESEPLKSNAGGQRERLISPWRGGADGAGRGTKVRWRGGTGRGVVEGATENKTLQPVVVLGVRITRRRGGGEAQRG